MNHERCRPKHQRAGCLLCKPHKDEREAKTTRKHSKRPNEAGNAECSADPIELDCHAMAAEMTDYEDSIEFLSAEEYTP